MQIIRFISVALLFLTVHATAQPPAKPDNVRPISLEEAIQLALKNNLDVQIELRNPEIFQYALSESYGVYEPTFGLRASHSFRTQPGGTDEQGRPLPSTEVENDSFIASPGISGYLPTGLTYDLSASASKSSFDNPQAGVTFDDFSTFAGISLRQPLLRGSWIDSRRMQILLTRKNLRISEWAFRQQVMSILTSVEQAYYNLIFARENVTVQQTALELVERLLVENQKRVEVGAMAPLDEQQARSQVAASQAQLVEARRILDAQENILKNLITDNYIRWHALNLQPVENLEAVPHEFEVTESWRTAIALRPDLQQLKLELEKLDITLRFDKNQLFPSLDLVGSYGYRGLSDGLDSSYNRSFDNLASRENPSYEYGVVFSIPLGNTAARNRLKATKTEKEQALLQYKRLEQQVLVNIDDAVKLVQAALDRVEATRAARLFAEAALDAEQKKLENGKSTSFFVLQFQRDLTQRRSEEIRALADYNNALAQLAFQEGSTLKRHNLQLDGD